MTPTVRTPALSRYRLHERIGSGGMGSVYRADDLERDRAVAVKVLPPGLQDDAAVLERFRREAQALGRIRHPHVAAVYDACVEGGFPYLVMELVEGRTLEQRIAEQGPLPIEETVRIGLALSDALAAVHAYDVVHRDVKASNIIVAPDGRAVLTDFGIAFIASLPRLSHGALGTPEYMSPEQADGRAIDGRSDVYSLGVVLFECLAGRLPFPRLGDSLADLTELMRRVQREEPPSLAALRAGVPAELLAVVQRCLAKRPEDRFPDAAALRQALESMGRQSRTAEPQTARTIVVPHGDAVAAVALSPGGRWLASAGSDRVVSLRAPGETICRHVLAGHDAPILSLAFSPDGSVLASGDAAGVVRLWDVRHARCLHSVAAHTALVMSVAFDPYGATLATCGADGALRLWDARQMHLAGTPGRHHGYACALAFSPRGARLASGGADGRVRLWDLREGRMVREMDAHDGWVLSVAYSPDGGRLATSGADGRVRLWETRSGAALHAVRAHRGWATRAIFSPDGTRVATTGRDGNVRLWQAARLRPLRRLDGHGDAVVDAAFSPDGALLATASRDRSVRLWPIRPPRRTRFWRFLLPTASAALLAGLVWAGGPGMQDMLRTASPASAVADDAPDGAVRAEPPVVADLPAPPPALPSAEHERPAAADLPGGEPAEDTTDQTTHGAIDGATTERPRDGASPPRALEVAATRVGAPAPSEPAARRTPRETQPVATRSAATEASAERSVERHSGRWALVVATTRSHALAARVARHFRAEGLVASVEERRGVDGVRFRVCVGRYATRREASDARRRLVRASGRRDVWLMQLADGG